MTNPKLNFNKIIQKLKAHYGTPAPPKTTDPFELILWENVAYLADDVKREKVFDELSRIVGLKPIDLLNAPLTEIDRATHLGGVSPQQNSSRLKECALIAMNDFGGDLKVALALPVPQAIKTLRQYPGIGEPGAEKILLFTKTLPVLALDSNGLRVMLRLGFGEEKKSYTASYKSVREAVVGQCGSDCESLIVAHQLLRQHGKTLCKTSKPRCEQCPVNSVCAYHLKH